MKEILLKPWKKLIFLGYRLLWSLVSSTKNSVNEFIKHIINIYFPKSIEWDKKIDQLFADAIARKIDFDDFFAELKYLPMIHIREMANFEKIPLSYAGLAIEPKLEIETSDLINIKRYMMEK